MHEFYKWYLYKSKEPKESASCNDTDATLFLAASKFCAEYFDQQKGDSHPALSVLRQLKSASEELALDVSLWHGYFFSWLSL